MPRPSSQHPTELELEILKVFWRDGASLAKHVCEEIQSFRKLAYTSVLTIMNIMTKKEYLKRTKEGKSFLYEAIIREEETTQNMLSDLVDRAFGGSVTATMVNLLETGDIDEQEIKELRKLLTKKGKEVQS